MLFMYKSTVNTLEPLNNEHLRTADKYLRPKNIQEAPLKKWQKPDKVRPLAVRQVECSICDGAMRNGRYALMLAEEGGKSGGEKCRGNRRRMSRKK